eukprot:6461913-Amphidinium_carterae.2
MSAQEPQPEPVVSPLEHIHHTTLPLRCGVEPSAANRTYILWKAGACSNGPYYYTGIHTGIDTTAWEGIASILGAGGYQPGVCRLQRVHIRPGQNILREAERLFWREAASHGLPPDFVPRLFVWHREEIYAPPSFSPRATRTSVSSGSQNSTI